MDRQERTLLDHLKGEFSRRVSQNSRYSLRAFALALEMNPGELSEILRGKRRISNKAAGKITQLLGLTEVEKKKALQKLAWDRSDLQTLNIIETETDHSKLRLQEEAFRMVSSWFALHFLSALDLKVIEWSPNWLAKRFGVSQAQARWAMDALKSLGLTKTLANGKIAATHENVETFSEVPSSAIRQFHREILQQALRAIDEQPVEERQTMGVGFAVAKSDVKKMKKEVEEFVDMMLQKYRRKNGDDVYFLETVLFKLSRKGDLA